MLKFLEEPNEFIIGFFITNNKSNVMLTIQSRCQMIEVNFEENDTFNDLALSFEELTHYIKDVECSKNSIIINKELKNLEKNDVIKIFKCFLDIYKETLDTKINNKKLKYDFLEKFSIKNIQAKIKFIIEILNKLNYNINVPLLLDDFVLEMEVINNEVI